MGWFTRVFGGYEGTVRFEGTLVDGTPFTGKVKVSTFLGLEELEDELKNILFVENGVRIATLRIIGMT